MSEEKNNTSEWNEQQSFAKRYFLIGDKCRYAQENNDIYYWQLALLSKISHSAGILGEHKKEIDRIRQDVINALTEYHMLRTSNNLKGVASLNCIIHSSKKLFDLESELDLLVNTKMPFLNVKEDKGLDQW